MTKKQKKMLRRILAAAVLFLAAKLIPMPLAVSTMLYAAAYLTVGYDILRKAWKGVCNHQVFDENFLMAVATIGAIALAVYEKSGDYAEAVAVMLFYQIGELFQSRSIRTMWQSVRSLSFSRVKRCQSTDASSRAFHRLTPPRSPARVCRAI